MAGAGVCFIQPGQQFQAAHQQRFLRQVFILVNANVLGPRAVLFHDQREIDKHAGFQAIERFQLAYRNRHHHGFHVAGDFRTGGHKTMMWLVDTQDQPSYRVVFRRNSQGRGKHPSNNIFFMELSLRLPVGPDDAPVSYIPWQTL